MKSQYICFPFGKVEEHSKIIIYGGGDIGKSFIRQINLNNYCDVIAIVDKNEKMDTAEGVKRIALDQIGGYDYDHIVVSVLRNTDEIVDNIEKYCDVDRIIVIDEHDYTDYPKNKESIPVKGLIPEHLELDTDLCVSLREHLNTHNIFNFISISSSLIDDDMLISKMLILSLKDNRKFFWVKKDNKVVGCVDLKDENTLNLLENAKTVCDIMDCSMKYTVCLDCSLYGCLREISFYNYEEILLRDCFDEICGITNRTEIYMSCCRITDQEKKPIFSRGYCHEKRFFPLWNKYKHCINSQTGEDGIMEEIFNIIGFQSRYAVEFGAWDGIYLSNIKNLIDNHSFSALYIEGDPERAYEGIKNYEQIKDRVHYAVGYVQHRKDKLLDDFLEEDNAPHDIDLLSIDIDGVDYHVWKSLEKYRPRVICIEYNQYTSNRVIEIPPLDECQSVGASAMALVELGAKKGYQLVAATEFNLIFVANEEYHKLKIANNDINSIIVKDEDYDNTWFQSFQGDIFNISKCNRYEISKIPFTSNVFTVAKG